MRSYEPSDAKEEALWKVLERRIGQPIHCVETLERRINRTRYRVTGETSLEETEVTVTDYEVSKEQAA